MPAVVCDLTRNLYLSPDVTYNIINITQQREH